MMNIPIITPILGYLMKLCYWLCFSNYGLALIVFTLIVKLITVPSQIKQQKNTAKMAKFSPKLKQLQKQYANNKQKYQEEMMKLYSEEGVNPMGSCLPMIVTMVILFGVIGVVYQPLNFISNIGKSSFSLISVHNETITEAEAFTDDMIVFANLLDGKSYNQLTDEQKDLIFSTDTLNEKEAHLKKLKKAGLKDDPLDINGTPINFSSYEEFKNDEDLVKKAREAFEKFPDDANLSKYLTNHDEVSDRLYYRPQLLLLQIANSGYSGIYDVIEDGLGDKLEKIDYTFFGIPLSAMPSWSSIYVLIPIISFLAQIALTLVSQYYQKKNNQNAAQMGGGMKIMLLIMPLFSFWISFSFPAGLGLYWTLSAVYTLIQTVILNNVYTPERVEKIIAEEQKKNKKRRPSMYERALAAQGNAPANMYGSRAVVLDENGEEKKMSKEEKKAYERQLLAQARKRMAEKYGDEYLDD